MKRYVAILLILIYILTTMRAQTQTEITEKRKTDAPKIVVTKLDISDKALRLVYEIRNDSEEDVWIFADICPLDWHISRLGMHVDVFMDEDNQTLVVRGRWCLPLTVMFDISPYGKYVRLRAGEKKTETIFLKIPVHYSSLTINPRFLKRTKRQEQEQYPEYATRLVIELGYYTGNFPEKIIKTAKSPEKHPFELTTDDYRRWRERYSHLPYTFNCLNERVTSREEEALIPGVYSFTEFTNKESEQVLRTVIENLRIPYRGREYRPLGNELPDFTYCNKIEIRYHPSMLEYFFPYAFLQGLLSEEEIKYFKTEHTTIFEDVQDIRKISLKIRKGRFFDSAVNLRYRSYCDMICYYDGKPPLSFPIYNDGAVVYKGECLYFGDGLEVLKKLTPRINAIELRIQCAANLKNQWYRFRYHNILEALRQNDLSLRNKTMYPAIAEWCDAMLRSFPAGIAAEGKWSKRYHVCPSAGEGENHYAMNPNCKPDSPDDIVLLFETKAGWNQRGGPELFTFDNHEPKGGCVLLNDGTVKFVRTKEKLQQLRWK